MKGEGSWARGATTPQPRPPPATPTGKARGSQPTFSIILLFVRGTGSPRVSTSSPLSKIIGNKIKDAPSPPLHSCPRPRLAGSRVRLERGETTRRTAVAGPSHTRRRGGRPPGPARAGRRRQSQRAKLQTIQEPG